MQKIIMAMVLLVLSTGCVKKTVTFEDTKELKAYSFTFVDTHTTDEPSFLTEHGNIWSCMYGINPVSEKEVQPNKALILKNYLETNMQVELANKIVALKRFDIYYNTQKLLRSTSVPVVVPGVAVPLLISQAETVLYGCGGKVRGEYALSEMPEEIRNKRGISPFVVHLNILVNKVPFNIRITSLNPVVASSIKEGDKYADILKATILGALQTLESNIKSQLKRKELATKDT